jgi:hypothetical protein
MNSGVFYTFVAFKKHFKFLIMKRIAIKNVIKLIILVLFIFKCGTSNCQSKDTSAVISQSVDYAFLNYNSNWMPISLDVYYSNGTHENLLEVLKLKGELKDFPEKDNYQSLNKAFQYLKLKGYELKSHTITTRGDKFFYREYIFIKVNYKH